MKIIQNLLLIFTFFFITPDLFAGLGNTNWGTWGIKRDIEVNEIEVVEEIEAEEKKDQYETGCRARFWASEQAEE